MRMMTEDEKNDIISGLKKKWEDTHKQYQALTFNIDTVTKVQRCVRTASVQYSEVFRNRVKVLQLHCFSRLRFPVAIKLNSPTSLNC